MEDENILVDDALYQQLKGIFAAIDNDVDGYLTRPQISLALQFVGIIPTNENLNYILFGQEDGDEEGTGVEKEQNITKEGEGVKGSKTKREKRARPVLTRPYEALCCISQFGSYLREKSEL